MTIQDFILQNKEDYDSYKYDFDWNGYKVYSVWLKSNEGACVGLPQFAIEKDSLIRLATLDETLCIMNITS